MLLSRALIELGHDVEVCCYFEFDDLVILEFKALGAKINLLRWSRAIGNFLFLHNLADIIKNKKPDAVHIQYMAPGFLPIVAAKLARVPVVLATVHYPGTPHGFAARLFLTVGALLTDCFTCVSQAVEKSWFGDAFLFDPSNKDNLIARNHVTIPNAVDIDTLNNALVEKTPKVLVTASRLAGKTVIGTVARLSSEKGVDVLLRAFALTRETMPHIQLLIAGTGQQQAYLQKLAAELGIADSCTWLGQLPWNEAMGCLGLMDIVVVPSRFEGFGLSAIEAMACGKPVVASRVGGLAEIIQDGHNGFLVPSEEIKSFADCIVALAKDEEKRKSIGKAARKCVEGEYAYPMFRERIRALYEMLGKDRFK